VDGAHDSRLTIHGLPRDSRPHDALPFSRRRTHAYRFFRHRVARSAERLRDRPVRVEVHLPVVIGMRIRAHGEHRATRVEVDDFDVGPGIRLHVRNLRERLLQPLDRIVHVYRVRELSGALDASIRAH